MPATCTELSDVRFPDGALSISDGDGDRIARPDVLLQAGHHYVVGVVDEVMNLLQGCVQSAYWLRCRDSTWYLFEMVIVLRDLLLVH